MSTYLSNCTCDNHDLITLIRKVIIHMLVRTRMKSIQIELYDKVLLIVIAEMIAEELIF